MLESFPEISYTINIRCGRWFYEKSAWFSFKNKDSPDYVSSYGDTYTDRQLAILNNEIPLYEIRPNELSILYKKAKQKNDVDSYEIAIQMYAEKTKP